MWKFLLAALAALIAIVIIIGGRFDLSQLASLQNLQLPSIPGLAGPTKAVDMRLWPANFTLTPTIPLTLNVGNTSLTNFTGTIFSDFSLSKITFKPTGTQFELTTPMADIDMGSADLSKLTFDSTKLEMTGLSATGNIDIERFSGTVSILNNSLRLTGNVTRLVVRTDNITWELK